MLHAENKQGVQEEREGPCKVSTLSVVFYFPFPTYSFFTFLYFLFKVVIYFLIKEISRLRPLLP
jgi:hypothetical protein